MKVKLHPHAQARILERGATEQEVTATIEHGEQFPAKFGRTGFRRNFPHAGQWRGKHYPIKQIEVIAVQEDDVWMLITVMVKCFLRRNKRETNL